MSRRSGPPARRLPPVLVAMLRAALGSPEEFAEHWPALRPTLEPDALRDYEAIRLVPVVHRALVASCIDDPLEPRLRGVRRRYWYENQLQRTRLADVTAALGAAGIDLAGGQGHGSRVPLLRGPGPAPDARHRRARPDGGGGRRGRRARGRRVGAAPATARPRLCGELARHAARAARREPGGPALAPPGGVHHGRPAPQRRRVLGGLRGVRRGDPASVPRRRGPPPPRARRWGHDPGRAVGGRRGADRSVPPTARLGPARRTHRGVPRHGSRRLPRSRASTKSSVRSHPARSSAPWVGSPDRGHVVRAYRRVLAVPELHPGGPPLVFLAELGPHVGELESPGALVGARHSGWPIAGECPTYGTSAHRFCGGPRRDPPSLGRPPVSDAANPPPRRRDPGTAGR